MFIIAFHYLLRMDLVSSSANSKTFNFASNIGALVAFVSAGKVVYRWTIAPPARTLAAGASAPFNSAEVNVPPGGDELTITLGEAGV